MHLVRASVGAAGSCGTREGTKAVRMITPVENTVCLSDLEGRGVGSFRNLTWLYVPYMLAGGGSTARREGTDWGQDMPERTPPPEQSPLLQLCMFRSRPSVLYWGRLAAALGIPVETE